MRIKTKSDPHIKRAVTELTSMWDQSLKQEFSFPADKRRAEELHPSSFPYCGLRHAYESYKHPDSEHTYTMGAMGLYYTSAGTAFHTFIQNVLGKYVGKKGGRIYGDWICNDCGVKRLFKPWKPCSCGASVHAQQYEEFGVKEHRRTYGHVDGLFKFDGRWYVIDYKTTSSYNVYKHKNGKKIYPYGYNVHQIQSYVVYLENKYDIKIHGWILIYAARDNPMTHYVMVPGVVDAQHKRELRRTLKRWDSTFHYVRRKFRPRPSFETIEPLIQHKTCADKEHYELHIKDPYNECPLAARGMCFNSARLTKHLIATFK